MTDKQAKQADIIVTRGRTATTFVPASPEGAAWLEAEHAGIGNRFDEVAVLAASGAGAPLPAYRAHPNLGAYIAQSIKGAGLELRNA